MVSRPAGRYGAYNSPQNRKAAGAVMGLIVIAAIALGAATYLDIIDPAALAAPVTDPIQEVTGAISGTIDAIAGGTTETVRTTTRSSEQAIRSATDTIERTIDTIISRINKLIKEASTDLKRTVEDATANESSGSDNGPDPSTDTTNEPGGEDR